MTTNYKMKFEVDEARAELRLNAYTRFDKKFASYAITNDELEWLGEYTTYEFTNYETVNEMVHEFVPSDAGEGLYEFLGSLDHYAKQHAEQEGN